MELDIKDIIHDINVRYPDLAVGYSKLKDFYWIYIRSNNDNYANLYISNNGKKIVSFNLLNSDEKFEAELTKTNYALIFDALDRQITAFRDYYKNLNNNINAVNSRIINIQELIESKCDLVGCVLNKSYNQACLMCEVKNIYTQKLLSSHLMYRIMYTPKGYVVTLIYNNPFDIHLDFNADTQLNEFIKQFNEAFNDSNWIVLIYILYDYKSEC